MKIQQLCFLADSKSDLPDIAFEGRASTSPLTTLCTLYSSVCAMKQKVYALMCCCLGMLTIAQHAHSHQASGLWFAS